MSKVRFNKLNSHDWGKHKKIVTVGGGTGSFTVLKGLKNYPVAITAIVTMFDSGGSSGILRDEFGVLPPGDVRRCLIALSEEEAVLRKLFMFRFEKDSSVSGHSFGNLFLTALSNIFKDDDLAIEKAGELLNIKGRVLPVSLNKSNLIAFLKDGTVIKGETNIDIPKHNGENKIAKIILEPKARLNPKARLAILQADYIVIGPGDLYTSVIPNFLVGGMAEAIQESKAKKVYVTNLMTKWGETHGLSASDCAKEILSYAHIPKFDYIICNNKKMSEKTLRSYAKEKKFPMVIDGTINKFGRKIVFAPLWKEKGIVRHDSDALAKIIVSL